MLSQANRTVMPLKNSPFQKLNDQHWRSLTCDSERLGHDTRKETAVSASKNLNQTLDRREMVTIAFERSFRDRTESRGFDLGNHGVLDNDGDSLKCAQECCCFPATNPGEATNHQQTCANKI